VTQRSGDGEKNLRSRTHLEVAVKAMKRFALLAAFFLLVNMVAMPFLWGGYSATEDPLRTAQMAILAGFAYIVVYDLVSTGFVLTRVCWMKEASGEEGCQKGWILVLAVLAFVGMMGAKVMVDEIGRETPLGMSAGGEWVILYLCLGLQLAFLLAILLQRDRSNPRPGSKS